MGQYKQHTTIRLPRSILEEIHEQDGYTGKRRGSSKKTQSSRRKEARKQGRVEQKQKKARFFSAGRKRQFEDELPEGSDPPPRKRVRTGDSPEDRKSKTQEEKVYNGAAKSIAVEWEPVAQKGKSIRDIQPREEKKKALSKSIDSVPPRSRIEDEEDAYITYLETKLGYARGKSKKKRDPLEEDGLDDLLDWADSFKMAATGDIQAGLEEEGGSTGESEDDFEGDGPRGLLEEDDGSEENDGEEWDGITASSETESIQQETESEEEGRILEAASSPLLEQPSVASTARYIPPHLRKKESGLDLESMSRLKKQLKGLLNRMSEQNLSSIIDGIEELYRNNRRHDVTSGTTSLIIEGISSHSVLLDSYVVLHAALISSLHKVVGVEFAAFFVQNVVENYERHRKELQNSEVQAPVDHRPDDLDPKGKECSNLMVLLSELYNFQVISSVLVFDLIRELLREELTEYDVELLLKLMRNSGQQLRHDDPTALKDIIDIVQKKVTGREEKSLSSRTRFMLETLVNLKNNKLKRNATQNQGGEAVERMKKFLVNLSKKKHVLAHDAIRVSLEDLRSADSKGKWWLVGAAWGGNPLIDAQEGMANVQVNGQTTTSNDTASSDLLKLARKQGMNTDIRRSIFVILMSSDDYVDACERLSQLSLTEVQQREVVRVLLHCCGNEKTYNPYYALVCQQLCRQSHSHKITLQFSLWDFLRDIGEVTVGGAEVVKNAQADTGFDLRKISASRPRNVARAYGWWIAKDIVNLTILKAVDFTILKPQSQQFLRELMLQIFASSQTATPLMDTSPLPTTRNRAAIEEIFTKAARIQNLAAGLVYFLANTFLDEINGDERLRKFVKWASELALTTLRTSADAIPIL